MIPRRPPGMGPSRLRSGDAAGESADDPSQLVLGEPTAEGCAGVLLGARQEGRPEAEVQPLSTRERASFDGSAPPLPITPCHMAILSMPAPGAEQDRDPSTGERRVHATIGLLEQPAEVGDGIRQDPEVLGPLLTLIRRVELVGHDLPEDRRVAEGRQHRLVSRVALAPDLHRTDVHMAAKAMQP
jgi:hypothetical protein